MMDSETKCKNEKFKYMLLILINITMSLLCHLCIKKGKSGLAHSPGPNCPVVKGFICGYCKEQGHTIKYCKILQAKNSEYKKASSQKSHEQKSHEQKSHEQKSHEQKSRVKLFGKQLVNHFGIMEDSKMPNQVNTSIDESLIDENVKLFITNCRDSCDAQVRHVWAHCGSDYPFTHPQINLWWCEWNSEKNEVITEGSTIVSREESAKPLKGVWGMKNAVDLVSTDKEWNL